MRVYCNVGQRCIIFSSHNTSPPPLLPPPPTSQLFSLTRDHFPSTSTAPCNHSHVASWHFGSLALSTLAVIKPDHRQGLLAQVSINHGEMFQTEFLMDTDSPAHFWWDIPKARARVSFAFSVQLHDERAEIQMRILIQELSVGTRLPGDNINETKMIIEKTVRCPSVKCAQWRYST